MVREEEQAIHIGVVSATLPDESEADFRAALEDDLVVPRALDVLDRARGATARRLADVLGLAGAD